jgi:hypothetical protein
MKRISTAFKHEFNVISILTLGDKTLHTARKEYKRLQEEFGKEDVDFKEYFPVLSKILDALMLKEDIQDGT